MGDKSQIEWTDATWNPVTGCTKVSQGCKNCYAERWFKRAYGRDLVDAAVVRRRNFTDVKTHSDRLDRPLRWKQPRRIFVNSMSDLFHEAVPDEFIDKVFAVMALAPQHTFQVLTKRPDRMRAFLSDDSLYERVVKVSYEFRHDRRILWGISISNPKTFPAKWIWLGVSVEDQATADERIPKLLQTPAAVRFVSAEPLLGPVDAREYLPTKCGCRSVAECFHDMTPKLDWVITGGESGPRARPMHPDWPRALRDQCQAAGVAFFFKQWGGWAPVCAQYPETEAEEDEAENASLCGDICISNNGYQWPDNYQPSTVGRPWLMDRVGKKKAGAVLDGREWKEFPKGRI